MSFPVIHCCYLSGNAESDYPFTLVHCVSVLLAKHVGEAVRVVLHCDKEPSGVWWDKVKSIVDLNVRDYPSSVQGNTIIKAAHKADVVRLEALIADGGIYIDLDVWILSSLSKYDGCECALGLQANNEGICNAVIVGKQNSAFLKLWQAEYKDFDCDSWDEHSVKRPATIASNHPELIHIQQPSAFFWPHYNAPYDVFFDPEATVNAELAKVVPCAYPRRLHKLVSWFECRIGRTKRQLMASQRRRLEAISKVDAVHLWESIWGRHVLSAITPEWFASSECVLAKRIREVLPKQVLDIVVT